MQFDNKAKLALATMLISFAVADIAVANQPPRQIQHPVCPSPKPSREQLTGSHPIPEEYVKAFEAQANRSLAVEKEARQLLKERRFAEAEKACYRSLSLSPKINGQPSSMTALQLLGDVYQEQGRYRDALDTYFKARKHMRNLELDLNIALCYLKSGDMANAHKFYSEEKLFGSQVEMPPAKKAVYMASLPGTKTAKTMEASIRYAIGWDKGSYARRDEAVEDFKKALILVPRNALIAHECAWDLGNLYRGQEAAPYWARAAVFGKGYIAKEGRIELKNILMPDQANQALRDAAKIR